MKIYDIKGMSRRLGVAVMGVAAAAVLVSCGDEAQPAPQPSNEPKAGAAAPAAAASATATPEEQMLDILLYKVVNRLSTGGLQSPFSAELREILSLLNEYYTLNGAKLTGSPKKVQLAMLIAEMRPNFRGDAEAVAEDNGASMITVTARTRSMPLGSALYTSARLLPRLAVGSVMPLWRPHSCALRRIRSAMPPTPCRRSPTPP